MSHAHEPKLYGQIKYEVESLASDITRTEHERKKNSPLFEAAMKLLSSRQKALSAILSSRK